MNTYIINGGKRLSGELMVSGSKNAALPLVFASLTVHGKTLLENVPNIEDVKVAVEIIKSFGADVIHEGSSLTIDASNVEYSEPSPELVSKIRASSYLMGACLSRFGRAKIYSFGGCNFENRPIDMHIFAMCALGAECHEGEISCPNPRGAEIHFTGKSVGASINALILASGAEGVSKIYGYAAEPHVMSLVDFYTSAGVEITVTPEYLLVKGTSPSAARARVIPDMIEAGTYIIASLLTSSPFSVVGADSEHLESFLELLRRGGASFEIFDGRIISHGEIKEPIFLKTAPYPGFPTDLQPQMAPLFAASSGGLIEESVWRSRFGYLKELASFGLKYDAVGSKALIYRSKLHCSRATAPDLRGGAALILTALLTDGESIIDGAGIIDRGYENIAEKLTALGASITKF